MITRAARKHRSRRCRQHAQAVGKLVPDRAPIDCGAAGAAPGVAEYLRALPAESRGILEMLAVLNLRMPIALLGHAAMVASPSAAIEPAVASGLVDWWPTEPSCPVAVRHPLVRDAIYASMTPSRRRMLHSRAAAMVSEGASWEHRVAALDRPDESLAAALEAMASEEAADGRLAMAATHLRWASDVTPVRADRERRLLTGALHLMLAQESRGLAWCDAVAATAPSPLRSCVLGAMAFAVGQLADAERQFREALAQAREDPGSEGLAAVIASRLAETAILLGDGKKAQAYARQALSAGGLDPAAASRARTLVAIGVCQATGPHQALAELAHLDADPARVGTVDVDGLAFRGVFRLLAGDLDHAVHDLTASLRLARRGATLTLGLRANCFLALARALVCQASEDYLGMADALGPWQDEAGLDGHSRAYAVLWRPLLAEGLIGSGQLEKAAAVLARMRAENGQVAYLEPALAWLDGWLAEQRGAPEKAREIYARAEEGASTTSPVHMARLLLAHGQFLRRTGNRKEAVRRLRKALEVYQVLRATPFIARAEKELAACRLPGTPGANQPVPALTSRETEVAHLVGKGLSNPEIAAELFISRKAVEYHLGNIYAKCGLHRRQELRRFVELSRLSEAA